MSKGIFVTGTGTDVGKTYVAAEIVKALKENGYSVGYYKAALSGADSIEESDAGYVKRTAKLEQPDGTLVSYIYKTAVSPHLAARLEGNPVDMDKVKDDYMRLAAEYDFVVVEGSGGIVCPIRWDDEKRILLEDVIAELGLDTVVVADSGLGTINAAVLTVEYLKNRGIEVIGVIMNRNRGGVMEEDNERMIEELTGVSVLDKIRIDTSSAVDISKFVDAV